MLSATASYGALMLWDVDNGLAELDKYMYASEDYVQAGALLGIGIVSSGIRRSLGFAYAGTCRAEVQELLIPIVADASASLDSICFAALSLGLVFRGSADEELVSTLMQPYWIDWNVWETEQWFVTSLIISNVIFWKKQWNRCCDRSFRGQLPGMPGRVTALLISIFGSSGTGDVLKIQELLNICGKHPSTKTEHRETNSSSEPTHDVLWLEERVLWMPHPMLIHHPKMQRIFMREDIGTDMAFRLFGHLLQYADPTVRKVVPLALGLLSVSYPRLQVMDLLSKLTHDNDREVAMLHFYSKDSTGLFVVRISQGILHMAKGLTSHVVTVDKELNPIAVPVRVGQAVDTVGQAGKPKTITGFQTHTTPVVIAGGERAELATEEYIAVDASLEGLVVLVKNPQYVKMEDA
eukprot:jgi/Galph1/1651/GphlegSOOS_G347.1